MAKLGMLPCALAAANAAAVADEKPACMSAPSFMAVAALFANTSVKQPWSRTAVWANTLPTAAVAPACAALISDHAAWSMSMPGPVMARAAANASVRIRLLRVGSPLRVVAVAVAVAVAVVMPRCASQRLAKKLDRRPCPNQSCPSSRRPVALEKGLDTPATRRGAARAAPLHSTSRRAAEGGRGDGRG
jgi:hypothetical protein